MKNLRTRIIFSLAISMLSAFAGAVCAVAQDKDGIKGSGNVILVGWDGAQRDHLMELLSSGQLPNLQKLISEGGLAKTEVTTGETATKVGWTEILTGCIAGGFRIISNFNYKPIPQGYTVFERLKARFGAGIVTIFITGKLYNLGVRGPHYVCANASPRDPVTRVRTFFIDRERFKGPTLHGKPPRWVRRAGEPYFNAAKAIDVYEASNGPAGEVGKQSLAALEKYQKSPFFAFFHFAEPDEQGHLYGENSREYGEAIITADQWLGEIVKKLSALGIYEKTTVYVATDHGMDEGGFDHRNAPHTFLAVNNKRKLKDGDRKDVTPTILEEYGVDLKSITPALDGKSLLCK
jgi:hypothetical protein